MKLNSNDFKRILQEETLRFKKKIMLESQRKQILEELEAMQAVSTTTPVQEEAPAPNLQDALKPIEGMTAAQIAQKIETALEGQLSESEEQMSKDKIKKYIYTALAGLGVTTSIASIVYTTLLSSPKTSPIVEKIIDGTLSPDASLIAGIIGIVLGGIIASPGVDGLRSFKK